MDVLVTAGIEELDAASDGLSEWQSVRRRLRDMRRAKVLQQRDADAGGALSGV